MMSEMSRFYLGLDFQLALRAHQRVGHGARIIEFPQAYLSTPAGAMAAVVIAKVWLSVPLFMAFFIAGLQSLDREQLEAARVDGAGNRHILLHHVLPHLRPVISW
jgi:multiple sugar transport system permease protein